MMMRCLEENVHTLDQTDVPGGQEGRRCECASVSSIQGRLLFASVPSVSSVVDPPLPTTRVRLSSLIMHVRAAKL